MEEYPDYQYSRAENLPFVLTTLIRLGCVNPECFVSTIIFLTTQLYSLFLSFGPLSTEILA